MTNRLMPTIDDLTVETIREIMEKDPNYRIEGRMLIGLLKGSVEYRVDGVVMLPDSRFNDEDVLSGISKIHQESKLVLGVVGHIGDKNFNADDTSQEEFIIKSCRRILPYFTSRLGYSRKQEHIPGFSVLINSQGSYMTCYLVNKG